MDSTNQPPELFLKLFQELEHQGFIKGTNLETVEYLRDKCLEKKGTGKKQGFQTWYHFSANGRSITVYTTYSPFINDRKKKHYGWVIIFDHRKMPVLFSLPMPDTASFFQIMPGYAKAFKELILHWPICPQCKKELVLRKGVNGIRVRRFECHTSQSEYRHYERRPELWMFELDFLERDNFRFLRSKYLPKYKKEVVRRDMLIKEVAAGISYADERYDGIMYHDEPYLE